MSIPLAQAARPSHVDEIIGQSHILGPDRPLRQLLEKDSLGCSLLFTGPPGCGKTTVAMQMKERFNNSFHSLNAVTSNIAEVKKVLSTCISTTGPAPILFIDEIHRFNSKQQDALLPHVEEGRVMLVATSTLSAYQSVTRPLLSRLNVFRFRKLKVIEIREILQRAHDLQQMDTGFEPGFLEKLAHKADGDARTALNYLEMCLTRKMAQPALTDEELYKSLEFIPVQAAKTSHYDYISAFIKSMRGSDPDATVYYLAAMLSLGEDPRFIARRMIIFASEDIGNADPAALALAISVMQAVEYIGMPEVRINLAHGATYLACAPKSNSSYLAIKRAEKDIAEEKLLPVPAHLKNKGGDAGSYQYPHNFEGHWVKQQYLTREKKYYVPTSMGDEDLIRKRLKKQGKT